MEGKSSVTRFKNEIETRYTIKMPKLFNIKCYKERQSKIIQKTILGDHLFLKDSQL